jgi:hypothetical protein
MWVELTVPEPESGPVKIPDAVPLIVFGHDIDLLVFIVCHHTNNFQAQE